MVSSDIVLEHVFNHIVLPSKLPGCQGDNLREVEKNLAFRMLFAVYQLRSSSDDDVALTWGRVAAALKSCTVMDENEAVGEQVILGDLETLEPEQTIILYLKEQNSTLLIRQTEHDTVSFEAFETSPPSEVTLAAKGALEWDFPTAAVSLPLSKFQEPQLQASLAKFLAMAGVESPRELATKARKAGVEIAEMRDTMDPALITDFLMIILEVNGSRDYPPLLRKRVKDDVCWEDAKIPWRRCPFWLVLRVSVQRLLYLELGAELGMVNYKLLMCFLLSRLLLDSAERLNPPLCHLLKAKLCRRLAKLESYKEDLTSSNLHRYRHLYENIAPFCQEAIDAATHAIDAQWSSFKKQAQRRIPLLPFRARENDFRLTLPNSSPYFTKLFANTQNKTNLLQHDTPLGPEILKNHRNEDLEALVTSHSEIAGMEMIIELCDHEPIASRKDAEDLCLTLSERIETYLLSVGDSYDHNTEQMGTFILNVFDLWVYLDKCATDAYPLLHDYRLVFESKMLDVLLLSRRRDMKRLQIIQEYLDERYERAGKSAMTIFTNPRPKCFADRYFETNDAEYLRKLEADIESVSKVQRDNKEAELEALTREWNDLTRKMNSSSCTQRRADNGSHDIRGCNHCYYVRRRRRLKINVHEDLLPFTGPDVRARRRSVVFELDAPSAFSAYRTVTWMIINKFCLSKSRSALARLKTAPSKPEIMLCDYSPLARFNRRGTPKSSLASTTKSYYNTHYKSTRLPARPHDVLLPNPLKLGYYSSVCKIWARDLPEQLSLAHHFKIALPASFPFSGLYSSPQFAADGPGPSSYRTISNTTKCPPELTVHEFMAHHSLFAGTTRRWLSILAELGSSNMNFSLQDTMELFHHIVLQAGPRLRDDMLRAVHVIFKDPEFCDRLVEQLDRHVDVISSNWREGYYMETLLTLTLRVYSLGHERILDKAEILLDKIRNVTLTWLDLIRSEINSTEEVGVTRTMARYGFFSALLCRRTFEQHAYYEEELNQTGLESYARATLAMQEHMGDLKEMPTELKTLFVRDIKMTSSFSVLLHHAVEQHPESLEAAISTVWPEIKDDPRHYTPWIFLPQPHDNWVTAKVKATQHTMPQTVHYHLLHGYLLVEGKALGKLPPEMRDSEEVKFLLGSERLLAFPSTMSGMEYVLGLNKDGYRIHLGRRGQQTVIRAVRSDAVFEYVPQHVFGHGSNLDLPASIVYDCVHWVNLQTQVIEARRKPVIWRGKASNWKINLRASVGYRRTSYLVDPHSQLFYKVAQIFDKFESPLGLTVFQPQKSNLSVELKRMDLDFRVNGRRLLACKRLSSEIDLDQDAGTFYGLQSMLVLRDTQNSSRRSILVTLGDIQFEQKGVHVLVRKANDSHYGRYIIDDVLGRLQCPPEPLLLYTKAQLHAYTSFILPDPLTGRTGTEEALQCLQSGSCQPWEPLRPGAQVSLATLADLTPRRSYYPKELRTQQTVSWNPHLTVTIQHESFLSVVHDILNKSRRLAVFNLDLALSSTEPSPMTQSHPLQERAHWRRLIYERPGKLNKELAPVPDTCYLGRNTWGSTKRSLNVREVANLLHKKPRVINTPNCLEGVLKTWPVIGGYTSTFSPSSLEECLNIDIGENWGALVNLCRFCPPQGEYNIVFFVGLIAFRSNADMGIIRSLISFFLIKELRSLWYPCGQSFIGFKWGEKPDVSALAAVVRPCCRPFHGVPIAKKKRNNPETLRMIERLRDSHYQACDDETDAFVEYMVDQWPCQLPVVDGFSEDLLDKNEALEAVLPEWRRIYDNKEFQDHISRVQRIINECDTAETGIPEPTRRPETQLFGPVKANKCPVPHLGNGLIQKEYKFRLSDRPSKRARPLSFQLDGLCADVNHLTVSYKQPTPEIDELEAVVNSLAESNSSVRSLYSQDLEKSIMALRTIRPSLDSGVRRHNNLGREIADARYMINQSHNRICASLSHGDPSSHWLQQGMLWSCTTSVAVLEQLRSTHRHNYGPNMKEALVLYAQAIGDLQSLLRINDAIKRKDNRKLAQEQNSSSHINWEPIRFPDWLLLEIDSNIRIREDQIDVALEMICPSSGSNTALQMNMGQGKTSVIMAMLACVFANGSMLSRFIVPRSLLTQTGEILQSRLGGLVGKEISHVPFSRRTPVSPGLLQEYRQLHEDMLRNSGIILDIPEHVLSFGLSGLQGVSDSKMDQAIAMVATSRWMSGVCRDVLDECDFTLAVRTQLIYPSGSQLVVDGHPRRWEVMEIILTLVVDHLRDIAHDFPHSIDVVERAGTGFPMAYFLRKDVEHALISRLVDDVCNGRLLIVPIHDCTNEEQQMIRDFISKETVTQSVADSVAKLFTGTLYARKVVYLLRGLFVHGILLLCLKKRWNVQYGLHHGRDPIAVPFRAKGVPSDQAEWGHPDVAILFTCLAFYYEGLTEAQLGQSLQWILKSDDPATEYDRWTQASTTLPEALRHWNIINVDDSAQVTEIWRHLRFTVVVINYFLNNFVFPVHAKQFSIKLQTSGWDIPLLSLDEEEQTQGPRPNRPGLTTGFSGTNDNRRLLPLTIEQQDLPGLSHTNAEVLTYLLQKRNRRYMVAVNGNGKRMTESDLIGLLSRSNIRILIDAGAFVLEMDNRQFVETWLKHDNEAQAAVFFGEHEKPWVLYRNKRVPIPLLATPFAENLEGCLVYLDEAHTRGTDLKLPVCAKGALTLGLNQTKDHTVQAAMRLRQLGTTQSVVFLAPPEVHQSILDTCDKEPNDCVDSSHVITWLLEQTCRNLEEMQPLYFAQGINFCRRMQASRAYNRFLTNSYHRKRYLDVLQLPEQQTLEELYKPKIVREGETEVPISTDESVHWKIKGFLHRLAEGQRHADSIFRMSTSMLEEVEQEREVAFEIEEERQVQRRPSFTPLRFPGLDQNILNFVNTGKLQGQRGYIMASSFLESTELGRKYKIRGSALLAHLFVSREFTRTVEEQKRTANMDNMIRPVNWILWSPRTNTALVIIPEEAEAIIPILRKANDITNKDDPTIYLILYAAPVTKRMLHFSHLNYFALPSLPQEWEPPAWLPIEIGLLAGRLYFHYADYQPILSHLRLNTVKTLNWTSTQSWKDTTAEESRRTPAHSSLLARKTLAFLHEWLSVRRSGQDISQTPMGYICQGWPLREDHPFFRMSRPMSTEVGTSSSSSSSSSSVLHRRGRHYYTSENHAGADDDDDDDDDVEYDSMDGDGDEDVTMITSDEEDVGKENRPIVIDSDSDSGMFVSQESNP